MEFSDSIPLTEPRVETDRTRTHFDHKPRALVVEDDPYWSWWFSYNLESLDGQPQVQFTDSVEGARQILRDGGKYDLIVCDNFLNGDLRGLDLWSTLEKENSKIPFVLTSGRARSEVLRERTMELPLPTFIEKNCSPAEFQKLVADMLAPDHSSVTVTFDTETLLPGPDEVLFNPRWNSRELLMQEDFDLLRWD